MDNGVPIDDALRRATVEARSEFYERQFGPLPPEIQKLLNLAKVWDGGIIQMAAPRLGNMGVCLTHGLSDVGMPVNHQREIPPGLAGYGYELAVLTTQPDPWPLLTLSWFVQMEILNDLGLLDHLAAGNGATVEGVKFGDGSRTSDFLVQPACAPVIGRVDLPNGLMHMLIATWITPDELEFAKREDDGRFVLLNKLVDADIGPLSRLDRPSVVGSPGGACDRP